MDSLSRSDLSDVSCGHENSLPVSSACNVTLMRNAYPPLIDHGDTCFYRPARVFFRNCLNLTAAQKNSFWSVSWDTWSRTSRVSGALVVVLKRGIAPHVYTRRTALPVSDPRVRGVNVEAAMDGEEPRSSGSKGSPGFREQQELVVEPDAQAEPFTPSPTRPAGMNPQATPWTPSPVSVSLQGFGQSNGQPYGQPYFPYFPSGAGVPAPLPSTPFPARASQTRRRGDTSSDFGTTSFRRPWNGGGHAPPSLPCDTHHLSSGGHQRPMNDYNSHFVATRERPQNFILDGAADTPTRLARFPTRKELAFLKREHTAKHAFPSTRLQCDLGALKLHPGTFGNTKFDVIYVNPPWGSPNWPASKVLGLTIEQIAEPNGCFVFLWCGDGNDHTLELGRECLAKWGFRRVEEIVWLKTNHDHCGNGRDATDATGTADDDDDNACQDERKDEDDSMDCQSERKDEATPTPEEPQKTPPPLRSTKEHCLVGIRGDVRRDRDGHIMHANIDVDVVVCPGPAAENDRRKPSEMYEIMENFCQGIRRIELFGDDRSARPGWLTMGELFTSPNFDETTFAGYFREKQHLPRHARIEALRPKTPPFAKTGTTHP